MVLSEVRLLPAVDIDAILAQVSTETVHAIEHAAVVGMVPMHQHMELCDAVFAHLGDDGHTALWRRGAVDILTNGYVQKLFQLTRRLFGATPKGLVQKFDHVYDFSTRGLGHVAVDSVGDDHGRVWLRNWPADQFNMLCFRSGLQGSLWAVIDAFEFDGEVAVLDEDAARGEVMYELRWRARDPASGLATTG